METRTKIALGLGAVAVFLLLRRGASSPSISANAAKLATLDGSFRPLVERFLAAMDELGVAIHINSALRSPAVNAANRGQPTSLHLRGLAVDVRIVDQPADVLDVIVMIANQSGLGVLEEFDPPHFHMSQLGREFGPGRNVKRAAPGVAGLDGYVWLNGGPNGGHAC